MSAWMAVRVSAARLLTPLIRELTLSPISGTLPAFSAGSHVQVQLQVGSHSVRNAYSLTGDPAEQHHYRIAVRLEADSRGGSQYIHQQLAVGDELNISAPANLFALHAPARHHLLIAGGIGITPFMAHVAALQARDASFELHFAYRGGLSDAYLAPLQQALGERLHCYDASLGQRLDLAKLLASQPLGSHLYTCGPQRLLDAVREQAQRLGWPRAKVHWEAFSSAAPGEPFAVHLARSNRHLQVAGEQSLLEALEAAGLDIPNLCRGGVCGQCVTRHLGGDVEHRDLYLTCDEQAHSLMPCVSRGCGKPLVLDL
ncbi:PDR/VanB family oxidoreductase [Pseudomonas silvicola]|nr:PDR/VanB family oxidoreductase [Pseudomonas silvicola]